MVQKGKTLTLLSNQTLLKKMGPWTLAHVLRSAKPEFSVLSLHPSSKFTKGQSCRGQEDGGWAQPSLQTSQLDPEKPTEAGIKHSLDFLSWILSPIYMTRWMSPKQGKVSIPLSYLTNQKLGLEFCMRISPICIPLVHIPQHFRTTPPPRAHIHTWTH